MFILSNTDPGYIALLALLVVVPTATMLAAVVDRMLFRRRESQARNCGTTRRGFPIIFNDDRP